MKITPEHYEQMRNAISLVRAAGAWPEFSHYQSQGLTHKRWRWDLLWYATKTQLPERYIVDTLYPYCDDTHIDTALKKIVA